MSYSATVQLAFIANGVSYPLSHVTRNELIFRPVVFLPAGTRGTLYVRVNDRETRSEVELAVDTDGDGITRTVRARKEAG